MRGTQFHDQVLGKALRASTRTTSAEGDLEDGSMKGAGKVENQVRPELWVFMTEIIIMVFIIKAHNSGQSSASQPQPYIGRIHCDK
jgi:hypothetical protein